MRIELPKFNANEYGPSNKSFLGHLIDKGRLQTSPSQDDLSFAFLVHPRNSFDALACARVLGADLSALARFIPPNLEQFAKNRFLYKDLARIPPFVINQGTITVEGSLVKGNLVAILLYGEQMLANGWRGFARERIIDAIEMCQAGGIDLVGLGAHTSPAVGGGVFLRKADSDSSYPDNRYTGIQRIGITNGNSFTAAVTMQSIDHFVQELDLLPARARVGIVGATGSVGSAASRLLVERGYRPLLIGRFLKKLNDSFSDIREDVVLSNALPDLLTCDVVVVMTSGATATILPEHIRAGTVVIEDTQPRNISEVQGDKLMDEGNLVVDGGFVKVPGLKCNFNLRLPEEVTFACLAETLILAMEGRRGDYSMGNAQVGQAKEMVALANKHNIAVAPPTWNSRLINPQSLKGAKLANSRRRRTVFAVA